MGLPGWLRVLISIHALLAESDSHLSMCNTPLKVFLSTLSLRRATTGNASGIHTHWISIHALLAESDDKPTQTAPAAVQFLSTLSLRRATMVRQPATSRNNKFLSTLSLRRATSIFYARHGRQPSFLSTLSLRRATTTKDSKQSKTDNFYPRSPCGERRYNLRYTDTD